MSVSRDAVLNGATASLRVATALAGALAAVRSGQWLMVLFDAAEPAGRLPWYVSRAAGVTAYLLLTASVLLGLLIASRLGDRIMPRAAANTLHEHLSWLMLWASALHAGALVLDAYEPFNIIDLLVPFAASYRTGAVALGIAALYLAVVVGGSVAVRPRLGYQTWRAIHFGAFAAYVGATAHGIMAGSSSGHAWMQWLYLGSGAMVLLLVNYRLLAERRARRSAAAGAARTAGRPSVSS